MSLTELFCRERSKDGWREMEREKWIERERERERERWRERGERGRETERKCRLRKVIYIMMSLLHFDGGKEFNSMMSFESFEK